MNAPAKHDSNRIEELDVLRGFAALAVLIYHYLVVYPSLFEGAPEPRVEWGLFAVHLFFMISGFVIFMTLAKTRTALDFVVSRFSRLFPVFWAAVLTTWIVVSFAPLPGRTVGMRHMLLNLTMLPEPLHVPYVDGVYWTLWVELTFYVLMLIFFVTGRLKRIEQWVLPWLGVQLIAAATERWLLPDSLPKAVSVALLLRFAHLFLAGILFYQIRFEGATKERYALIACCFTMECILHGPWAGVCATLFFALFYLLATERLGWLSVRPFVFLGTISYSLYLVHQNIGYVILRALDSAPLAARVTAAMGVSIVIATILTFFVEKPALRLIRALYKKTRARPADAALSPAP